MNIPGNQQLPWDREWGSGLGYAGEVQLVCHYGHLLTEKQMKKEREEEGREGVSE